MIINSQSDNICLSITFCGYPLKRIVFPQEAFHSFTKSKKAPCRMVSAATASSPMILLRSVPVKFNSTPSNPSTSQAANCLAVSVLQKSMKRAAGSTTTSSPPSSDSSGAGVLASSSRIAFQRASIASKSIKPTTFVPFL